MAEPNQEPASETFITYHLIQRDVVDPSKDFPQLIKEMEDAADLGWRVHSFQTVLPPGMPRTRFHILLHRNDRMKERETPPIVTN